MIKRLHRKIKEGEKNIVSYRVENPDASVILFTYGSTYRVARAVMRVTAGVGIFKADTLFPFPEKALKDVSESVDRIVVLEMNTGKIHREVERIACCEVSSVTSFGRLPHPMEVLKAIA